MKNDFIKRTHATHRFLVFRFLFRAQYFLDHFTKSLFLLAFLSHGCTEMFRLPLQLFIVFIFFQAQRSIFYSSPILATWFIYMRAIINLQFVESSAISSKVISKPSLFRSYQPLASPVYRSGCCRYQEL